VSFRREAHTPKGGPDGGDGGSGGDIWLVANHNVSSLLAFRDHPHRKADSGTHGKGAKRHGSKGDDLIVPVPIGTQIYDWEGQPLADFVGDGDRWLAAEGGVGGKGNARFLSNKRRAPGFAEQGEHGEERWIRLELKLMADVALVGFPNVGKSTLISRISAAKPKIADYPFTTLEPNLGVVRTDDGFEMVVADIPGLIEGAAEGKGLGHQFLRHIERARVLVLLLDLSPFAGASWQDQEATLLGELGDYRPDLVGRPRLRIGSRADLAEPDVLASFDGLVVSAVTGEGVAQLIGALRRLVEQARAEQPPPEGFVTLRPLIEGITISRNDDGSFNVEGREALRAVNLNDLTNPEAMDIARERLDKLGVDRSLGRAGARNGDVVHIGKLSFEFESDTDMVAQPFDEAPVKVVADDEFSDFDDEPPAVDEGGADDVHEASVAGSPRGSLVGERLGVGDDDPSGLDDDPSGVRDDDPSGVREDGEPVVGDDDPSGLDDDGIDVAVVDVAVVDDGSEQAGRE